MLSKKNKKATPSLIAQDVNIIGTIKNTGMMQLDGHVEGEVSVDNLTVGLCGGVDGKITAKEVTIKGKINGTITADKVILEKTAHVIGDIFHGTISIEEGATIQGAMNHKSPTNEQNVTPINDQDKAKKSG